MQGFGAVDLADDFVEHVHEVFINVFSPKRIGYFGFQHVDVRRGFLVFGISVGGAVDFVVPHGKFVVVLSDLGALVVFLVNGVAFVIK